MRRADKPSSKQWDANLYDGKHSFVWKYGLEVIELLSPKPGERILDLGCGTGHLTHQIAECGAQVIGIDNSSSMIEQARKNYPGLRFELADGTAFHFTEPFDAVFSNAAIHWMEQPEKVVACVWAALKPGGRFVGEFGGKGNVRALHRAIRHAVQDAGFEVSQENNFRYFPSIGEYSSLLEARGFRVTFASHFDRLTPLNGGEQGLKDWVEMFASSFLSAVPPESRDAVIRDAAERLRPELYREGTWYADYRRIRVVAIKDQSP